MDQFTKLCACERWLEAEALAREDLEAAESRASDFGLAPLEGPELEAHRQQIVLPWAHALRRLVDVLVDAERAHDATEHLMELRRLYRPFLSDHGRAAEYFLTVAKHAASAGQAPVAKKALETALEHAATSSAHGVLHAQALRLKAHLAILRWEPDEGVALLSHALAQLGATGEVSALLRMQYLFTLAEVHLGREDRGECERCVVAALDVLASMPLVNEVEIVEHSKRRAEFIRTVNAAEVSDG